MVSNLELATYTWSQLKEFLLDGIEDAKIVCVEITELQQGA